MASIARKNLFEDIPRFLVAQAGIMFAVSLVTIQLGILKGFTRSTAIVLEQSKADLWVASDEMVYFELTSPLPAEFLTQAEKVPGVERAEVLLLRSGRWRDSTGDLNPVRIFGFNPDGQLFAGWRMTQGDLTDLKVPYTFLIDQDSRRSLGLQRVGESGSIGFLPAKLGGFADDVQSNASSPFVFTSLETANAYGTAELSSAVNCTRAANGDLTCINNFKNRPLDQKTGKVKVQSQAEVKPPRRLSLSDPITYILIQAKPGEDLSALRQRLEAALPSTKTFTRSEMVKITHNYWERRTGVGFILG
ncbi:MAG: ABC transporter permease, partial [Synechococcales bacterium]|nr:ABC transporter permease [Synechococcales bacterium]